MPENDVTHRRAVKSLVPNNLEPGCLFEWEGDTWITTNLFSNSGNRECIRLGSGLRDAFPQSATGARLLGPGDSVTLTPKA